MKNVFLVLNGDDQNYFIEQQNAEKHANNTNGDLCEEQISEKVFKQKLKENGFFVDAPELPQTNNKSNGTQPNANELAKQLEALQAENEQLKQKQSLSFEDAAELFRHKAKTIDNISMFNTVLEKLFAANEQLSDGNLLKSDYYAVQLVAGNYSNKSTVFSVSNVEFIKSFIAFADDKIRGKVQELKVEVQAI